MTRGTVQPPPENQVFRPLWAVALLVGLALVTRVPFFFGEALGEADAARLVQDALLWDKAGIRSEALSGYRFYVSPAYITLARCVYHLASPTGLSPVWCLSLLNLVAGLLAPVLVFLLARRLAGNEAGLVAGLVFLAMPTAWYGSLYAFPHLLAVTSLLGAFVLFARASDGATPIGGFISAAVMAAVGSLLLLAAALKGDAYLGAAALPVVPFAAARPDWRRAGAAAILVCAAAASAVVIGGLLLQDDRGLMTYMAGFESQYGMDAGFLGRERAEDVADSWGRYVTVLAACGFLLCAVQRRYWRLLLLALMLAPAAFWSLRPGDSMRHHLSGAPGIALAIGFLWSGIPARRIAKGTLVAVAVVGSLTAEAPFTAYFFPSSNVLRTAPLMRTQATGWTSVGNAFAAEDTCRRILLGALTEPYANVALLARNDVLHAEAGQEFGLSVLRVTYGPEGDPCVAFTARTGPEDALERARRLTAEGVATYVGEWDWPGVQLSARPKLLRVAP